MKIVAKKGILELFFIIAVFFLVGQFMKAQTKKSGKVLFLNSYHKGYKWSDDITKGIENKLTGQVNELHIEYLDTKRQFDEVYLNQVAELIKLKHHNHIYDVIITSDDNAFNFALKYRDDIFRDVPIVFCGVNYFTPDNYENLRNVTGINEVADIESNINLIRKLHPQCDKIIVVTDNTTTGRQVVKKVNQLISKMDTIKIPIEIVYDVSENELIEKLSHLNSESIVLYTFFFKDKNGKYFDFIKGARLVCDNSKQPVYGAWDFSMGYGILGGYLEHGYTQGIAVAERALDILRGKSVKDLPVVSESSTKLQFDYRVLNHFNIDEKSLPENSEVLFKPVSFYDANKVLIWQVVILLIVMTLFIFVLAIALKRTSKVKVELEVQNKLLIKTDAELNEHKTNLENLVEERTSKIEQLNQLLLEKNSKLEQTNEQLIEKTNELEKKMSELKQAQKQLVHSEKMASIGVLTAGIAHEINNPLNFIVSGLASLEIALDEVFDSVQKNPDLNSGVGKDVEVAVSITENIPKLIDAIRIGVNRTTEIVLGLKKFSRIDEGEKHLADIHEILESTLIILKNKLKHRIELKKNYGELPEIYCFASKLAQVFLNILINAIQSINDSGKICITTSIINSDEIMIQIQDDGNGVPRHIQDKIFDPFFTTKAVGEGTGLGLSIVHGIINEHNGYIKFDSEEKIGTIVSIYLPVNQQTAKN